MSDQESLFGSPPQEFEGCAGDQLQNAGEVTEGNEQGHQVLARESAELTQDKVSHIPIKVDQPFSLPENRRSESPLFEPAAMSDSKLPHDTTMLDAAQPGADSSHSSLDDVPLLDGFRRSRAKKALISKNLNILGPKIMRSRGHDVVEDPENHAIKEMRQKDRMSWEAIAAHLNEERMQRGEPQTWTSAAVYSRFVRNAPRIATAKGETGFDPTDYMYLRNPAKHPASQIRGAVNNPSGYQFGAGGGRKRVRDDEHAEKDLEGNFRKKCAGTLTEQAKMLEQCDVTEQLMDAVAKVEKGFWGHVANELEKETGKLFDPKVLESRYHSIKW